MTYCLSLPCASYFVRRSTHPQAAVRMKSRIVQVPSKDDVEAGMPYTAACLQETLRKYSIVPVLVRTAVQDTKLLGRYIPAGTKCSLMLSSTHGLWKDSETYSPERFLPGGEFDSFPEDVRKYDFLAAAVWCIPIICPVFIVISC